MRINLALDLVCFSSSFIAFPMACDFYLSIFCRLMKAPFGLDMREFPGRIRAGPAVVESWSLADGCLGFARLKFHSCIDRNIPAVPFKNSLHSFLDVVFPLAITKSWLPTRWVDRLTKWRVMRT